MLLRSGFLQQGSVLWIKVRPGKAGDIIGRLGSGRIVIFKKSKSILCPGPELIDRFVRVTVVADEASVCMVRWFGDIANSEQQTHLIMEERRKRGVKNRRSRERKKIMQQMQESPAQTP